MNKSKIFIAIIFLYTVQFIISCCPDPGVVELTIDEIEGRSFEIIGNFSSEIIDNSPVDKGNYALFIYFRENRNKVSATFESVKSFGMSSAMATSCKNDEFIYKNDVASIEILAQDSSSSAVSNVTDVFRYKNENNELLTVSQFIASREKWQTSLEVSIVDESKIPSSAFFTVNVELTSGESLTYKTNEIVFN
jgi:hypothetical protein